LIVDHSKKFNRLRIGHVRAAHLDSCPFPGKLRVRFGTLAVQQERSVGVETLLKFVQARIRTVPWIGLVHDQHGFIGALVVADDIDYANARGFLIGGGLVFQFG
jgi:hypothetical protein